MFLQSRPTHKVLPRRGHFADINLLNSITLSQVSCLNDAWYTLICYKDKELSGP